MPHFLFPPVGPSGPALYYGLCCSPDRPVKQLSCAAPSWQLRSASFALGFRLVTLALHMQFAGHHMPAELRPALVNSQMCPCEPHLTAGLALSS